MKQWQLARSLSKHPEVLEIVLQMPHFVAQVAQQCPPAVWRDGSRRAVFSACCRLAAAGTEPTVDRLLLEIDDAQLKTLIIELDDLGRSRQRSDRQKELEQLLETICEPSLAAPRLARPASGDATANVADLLKIVDQKRRRQGISRPMDGQGCS